MILDDLDYLNLANWYAPLNRGLQAWYIKTPNLRGGTKFFDIARHRHGTLTNMDPATDWTGPQGGPGWGALDFDGTNDHIVTTMNAASSDFYCAVWFYPRSGFDDFDRVVDKKFDTGFWLGKSRPSDGVDGWGGGVLEASAPFGRFVTNIVADDWNLLISSRKGTTHTIYGFGADGSFSSVSGTVSSTALSTDNMWIAAENTTGGAEFLDGLIADVRFGNIGWTEEYARQYYNLSRQRYPGLLNRIRRRTYFVQAAPAGDLPAGSLALLGVGR